MPFQNIIATKLGQQEATSSYELLYKTPLNTRTIVKALDICNTTTAGLVFSVSFVPATKVAGAANAIFYEAPIAGNTTVQWCGTQVLNAGDSVYIKASAAGVVISVTGGEGT
jgi:hypothetical protein